MAQKQKYVAIGQQRLLEQAFNFNSGKVKRISKLLSDNLKLQSAFFKRLGRHEIKIIREADPSSPQIWMSLADSEIITQINAGSLGSGSGSGGSGGGGGGGGKGGKGSGIVIIRTLDESSPIIYVPCTLSDSPAFSALLSDIRKFCSGLG